MEHPNLHPNSSQGSRSSGGRPKSSMRIMVLVVALVVIIVGLVVASGQGWLGSFAGAASPDKSLYQATFLTNGQVYFGKLKDKGDSYVMTDVYYLQVVQPLQQQQPGQQGQQPAANQQQVQQSQQGQQGQQPALNLVRMGSEIHGPTSKMVIPKTSVVFWEDIKKDGTVGQAITEFKNRQSNSNGDNSQNGDQ